MPTEFKIPELGENISSGDVVRLLVSPGDTLAKDQPVLELETDKATIEVPSDVSGTVKDVRVKAGEKVKVGQVVLTIDTAGAAEAKSSAKPKAQPAGAPEEGGVSQATAPQQDKKAPAAQAPADAARAETERDRGTVESKPERTLDEEVEAEPASARQRPRGEVVEISRGARTAPAAQPQPAEPEAEGPSAPAAPSVRRLARELGVDIRRVSGTGADGRISVDDVQAFVRAAMSGGGAPARAGGEPLPDFSKWGEIERKPMSNIRRKTAEHLSAAWTTIQHVTQCEKADITSLEALRKKYAADVEKREGKLTVTAILVKVLAAAVKQYPQFNASLDMQSQEIVYKRYVNVGVAVDTDRGLLVPVIRNADQKNITEIAIEVQQAAVKARDRKLTLDDMSGGTISISNLGGIGGTYFTPIVNWPEVAILGVSRGHLEPVWTGSAFEPRLMLPLSLSYDHRLIDGADAMRFLRWVADALEQPFLLSLHG
jgi:pyruvate dehydrogenase E2 component (dihydrolipoamide acetyltransferase)